LHFFHKSLQDDGIINLENSGFDTQVEFEKIAVKCVSYGSRTTAAWRLYPMTSPT